jgi:hypothetical protein
MTAAAVGAAALLAVGGAVIYLGLILDKKGQKGEEFLTFFRIRNNSPKRPKCLLCRGKVAKMSLEDLRKKQQRWLRWWLSPKMSPKK